MLGPLVNPVCKANWATRVDRFVDDRLFEVVRADALGGVVGIDDDQADVADGRDVLAGGPGCWAIDVTFSA